MSAEKKPSDFRLLRRLWPFARPHARLLLIALVIAPLVSWIAVYRPVLLKLAIDQNLRPKKLEGLRELTVLFAALLFLETGLQMAMFYLFQVAGQRIMRDLRIHLFRHILTLRQEYFDCTPVGRTLTRVTSDVEAVNEFLSSGFVTVLSDCLMLLGLLISMLLINWRLTLASFVVFPFTLLGVQWLRKRLRRLFTAVQRQTSRLNGRLAENLSGMRILQAFSCEEWAYEGFFRNNRRLFRLARLSVNYSSVLSAFVEALATFSIASGLLYGSYGIHRGMSLGVMVLFLRYLQRFYRPVEHLANKFSILQRALASSVRIFKLLDDPRVEEHEGEHEMPELSEGIRFDKVHFAYPGGPEVIRGISLSIKAGEKVALVGATGAGKSTLARLLTRLYEPTAGEITVDGKPLADFAPRAIRRSWAVVPQDPFLFSRSIRENLNLDRGIAETRLEEACWHVGGESFLDTLPSKLDARLGERGGNLSQGERQLLAFARVLAHDPKVLILDEATASVDSDTEQRLQQAIQELLRGRTAVVIAHRLSTVQSCNRIFVLKKGEVVEEGDHRQLIRRGGLYARLCQLQLTG